MKAPWLLLILAGGPLVSSLHAENDAYARRLSILVPAYSYDINYYKQITGYVRTKIERSLTISNPGTVCAADYATNNVFDVICVFENMQGYHHFTVPDSLRSANKTRFAALPHTQPDAIRPDTRQPVDFLAGGLAGPFGRFVGHDHKRHDRVARTVPFVLQYRGNRDRLPA